MKAAEPLFVPSTDGVQIALHDLGGDDGDDILLISHATGFCGRAYEDLAAELSGHFHVMALDFRGHGDSSVPANGNFDWRALADDLLAAIDAIAAASPRGDRSSPDGGIMGFGHSLGGGVMMLAEAKRPGTFRAAHLFEPIVLPVRDILEMRDEADDRSQSMALAARRRRATFPSKAEALYRYASRPPLGALQASSLAAYVEHGMAEKPGGGVRLKCSPESEAATFDAHGKPTTDTLRGIQTPTTIAIGTTERGWTPAAFGPLAAAALPNGRLERRPSLGHFGPLERPVTVGEMVLDSFGRGRSD